MTIRLVGLPIPPSENNMYVTSFKTRRRFPSNELKHFKLLMLNYASFNNFPLKYAREEVLDILSNPDMGLYVRLFFYFKHDRIYTKKGEFKKMDVSNRIKAIADSVSDILGIDDKVFLAVTCRKVVTCQPESVSLEIRGIRKS